MKLYPETCKLIYDRTISLMARSGIVHPEHTHAISMIVSRPDHEDKVRGLMFIYLMIAKEANLDISKNVMAAILDKIIDGDFSELEEISRKLNLVQS